MGNVKEIEDKAKAPKLNKDASKRFVRNALWSQAQGGKKRTNEGKLYAFIQCATWLYDMVKIAWQNIKDLNFISIIVSM